MTGDFQDGEKLALCLEFTKEKGMKLLKTHKTKTACVHGDVIDGVSVCFFDAAYVRQQGELSIKALCEVMFVD